MADYILPPKITLQADSNQYLTRWEANGLKFAKSEPDQYCVFNVNRLSKAKIALQADNKQWLTRYGDPGEEIQAHKDNIDECCKFGILFLGKNLIALKGNNGKWLSRWDVGLSAGKDTIDQYCKFKVGEPLISKEIVDVKYNTSASKISQLSPLVALETTVSNPSSVDVNQTLTYEYEKSETGTWNNSAGIEIGVTTSFKTGVPFLAEGQVEVSTNASYSHEWGGESGITKKVSSSTSVTVPANSSCKAKVLILQANIDVPFTFKTKRTYIDGTVEKQPGKGIYNNVESFSVKVDTSDIKTLKKKK
eukprot:TRINITY_DN159_c0_g1_i1.p1 TRINITY_DN159_c0_g1~~TRINITY_DN159_c0_g1_i1.p1  ORF type:complete len:316 (-),score=68.94 TRINITY_DN159_c0_g1_i1:53-970(-)